MSVLRLAIAATLVGVVAACDQSPTAPEPRTAALVRANAAPSAIEGDTTACRAGWIIVSGRYECLTDGP